MLVDVYASSAQYWRHLAPVVDQLRARELLGTVWANEAWKPWGRVLHKYRDVGPCVLLASALDARRFRGTDRTLVYLEHGAGQTYVGAIDDGAGYPGGPGLEAVELFLAPNDVVAERWTARYPQAAVETVGCPAIDWDLDGTPFLQQCAGLRFTIGVTSHWRCGVAPEAMPALPRYLPAVEALQDAGAQILGHAHPRGWARQSADLRERGLDVEQDPDRFLQTIDLLIADNTSLMYEAAALDIPVVAINDPSYRRDVEHGLRFWSHVPGVQCDEPADLFDAVALARSDPPQLRALRHGAAVRAYAAVDGFAAQRAADAIERLCDGRTT